MGERFAYDPFGPIHKRWMTPSGPIRVMCEPAGGYVMARRPHCSPFVLHVSDLMGSAKHPHPHGPFTPVGAKVRRSKSPHGRDNS